VTTQLEVFRDGVKLPPSEYWVLQPGDLFAPPALYGYVHLVQSFLELTSRRALLSEEEASRLRALVARAHDVATGWSRIPGELP
jgi:hypothetical protein